MERDGEFQEVFARLRGVLRDYERSLVVVQDQPQSYYLDTVHILPNRKPLFFGSVRIGSRYVSFHLMPVYLWPEMLETASAELRRRMQGKSCFNFRKAEPELFEELAALVRSGFERYRENGYVA